MKKDPAAFQRQDLNEKEEDQTRFDYLKFVRNNLEKDQPFDKDGERPEPGPDRLGS